jgi:hypothetical protein
VVEEILADRRFAFCHDPRYPLTPREAELCPYRDGWTPRCPMYGPVCAARQRASEVPPSRGLELELPTLPALPRALVLGLLALSLAGGLALVLRTARSVSGRQEQPEAQASGAAAVEVAGAAQPIETDSDRLLARARAAAEAGDLAGAILALHAALLRRLEGAGLIAVDPSRTNGDYLRAVGRVRPDLAAPVRSLIDDVERVQFGGSAPSADLFQSLLARLAPLTARLGTVLLLAFLLGAGACGRERGDDEYSPSGRAGVIALLQRVGERQVHERVAPLARLGTDEADTLILLPNAELGAGDWTRLLPWVHGEGGTLVLAGVPAEAPDWLGVLPPVSAESGALVVGTPVFEERHGLTFLRAPPGAGLRLEGGYVPLLVRGKGGPVYAAEELYSRGRILALADDRLFTNGMLPVGNAGSVLLELLEHSRRIELVGELTGVLAPDPVASVRRGRLAPFLGQLALLCTIFFLYRGVAFGRLRDPPPRRRRSFVEHVEALATQYRRARAARHALGSYGQYLIERLRARVSLPAGPQAGLIALAEAVAARSGRPVGDVMRLLVEAREVPAPAAPGTSADVAVHLQAVRSLAELTRTGGARAED